MKCPNCNHENIVGSRFCESCGSSLAGIQCGACQQVNPIDAQFCEKCGAQLTPPVRQPESASSPKRRRGVPVWLRAVGRTMISTVVSYAVARLGIMAINYFFSIQ